LENVLGTKHELAMWLEDIIKKHNLGPFAIHAKGHYVRKGRRLSSIILQDERSGSRKISHIKVFGTAKKRYNIPKIPISKIASEILINGILTVLSTAIANPAPIIFYQIYKKGMFSYKILKKINESDFIRTVKNLSKMSIHRITDNYIDGMASDIALRTRETGYFKEISQNIGVSERVVFILFDSTLNKGLSQGSDSLTDFVVEGVM